MAQPKIAPPPVPRRSWPGPCPSPVTDENRIIGSTPIYDLQLVKELVQAHGVVVLNDETLNGLDGEGKTALPPPAWSDLDVINVILALDEIDFENCQWCKLNVNRYLDCDSYTIYFSRTKGRWEHGLKLYVKFGFNPNVTVPKAIVCRLHPASR